MVTVTVSETQRLELPPWWTKQQRERHGFTPETIDQFASWLANDVRSNSGRVNEPGEKFTAWLDGRWSVWRAGLRADAASQADIDRTDALLREQAERRANLPPVADVLEGLRAGRARR